MPVAVGNIRYFIATSAHDQEIHVEIDTHTRIPCRFRMHAYNCHTVSRVGESVGSHHRSDVLPATVRLV